MKDEGRMNFLELKDISEQTMELINPTSADKVLSVGRALGLKPGSRVIDFGCGFGEVLALWAEQYGIYGLGIDLHESACERARWKMAGRGVEARVEIVCERADQYRFERGGYDAAACLGASFIWGGFQPALRAMSGAIHPQGRLVIGEPYWQIENVPEYVRSREKDLHTEWELFQASSQEGCDIEYVVRASPEDWDRYESENWQGLLCWLEEHPRHPGWHQVREHLEESQEYYLRYGRQYIGWAMYVLKPRMKENQ